MALDRLPIIRGLMPDSAAQHKHAVGLTGLSSMAPRMMASAPEEQAVLTVMVGPVI